MNRIIVLLIALSLTAISALANYTLYSFSGNITIRQAGKNVTPEKGMKVGAADEIVIGPGATVEIFNATTKEIFKSTGEGKTTPMGIMLDARKQSGNTFGAINDRWTMSKSGTPNNNRLYTEGLVKRSMHIYDPAAENKEVAPHELALHIYNIMSNPSGLEAAEYPTEMTSAHLDGNGMNFRVANTLAFPIYMNVIKYQETGAGSIELSELGQPISSYVILPGQSITREQLTGLNPAESHILILTFCRFDIDSLIEETNKLLKEPVNESPDVELPVYLKRL
ncbi:MAG: hypothetical protein K2M07_07660 [Muribaculaceae bacterium]|nr:hypothetical protein [Muribaculaceae bacterium]